MLQKTSRNFREFFLLEFTRELINQSYLKNKDQFDKINTLHKVSQKDVKKRLLPKKKLNDSEFMKSLSKPLETSTQHVLFKKRQAKPVLRVPEPRLPPALRYLTPTPTNQQIDLERLNPLIQDPLVKTIECNGPGQQIIVKGNMGTKKTSIILNDDEIDDVLQRFSKAAKIPIHEGVFRVALGKLVLSAIVSNIVGVKFVIKKINMYAPRY